MSYNGAVIVVRDSEAHGVGSSVEEEAGERHHQQEEHRNFRSAEDGGAGEEIRRHINNQNGRRGENESETVAAGE